jgi:hypothetical protein
LGHKSTARDLYSQIDFAETALPNLLADFKIIQTELLISEYNNESAMTTDGETGNWNSAQLFGTILIRSD